MRSGHFKRCASAVSVVALLSLNLFADTYPRQPGIKITHYTFDVILSETTDEITMKETVDVDLLNSGVAGIDLDLCGPHARGAAPAKPGDPCVGRANGTGLSGQLNDAASASTTGMTVTAVTSASRPLTFSQKNDVVHVTFPSPSQAGQHISFD